MEFLKRAKELEKDTIADRRWLHKNAETGLDMPRACAYISDRLRQYGMTPCSCGHGIVTETGSGGRVILLRADMDALPIPEESGEPFACTDGNAHACGHDLHAAMLLTAARMLNECRDRLKGRVKIAFQPAEETLLGARDMVQAGLLKNPEVDAALAFHTAAGKMSPGTFMYNSGGVMMSSSDGFRVEITGKSGHGAYPHLTVDPLNIAVHTHLALESLIAREANPESSCVLTVGKLESGTASNIIPDRAVLEGMLRTDDEAMRCKLARRVRELSSGIAEIFGGSASVTELCSVPALCCDSELTEKMIGFIRELEISGLKLQPDMKAAASEDFAVIAQAVPAAYIYLTAGFDDERGSFCAHNSKVVFNEQVCHIGSAAMAHCAARWLEQ